MTHLRIKHCYCCGQFTIPLGVALIFIAESLLCGGLHVVAQSGESSTEVASESPSVVKNVEELQWPRFSVPTTMVLLD